MSETIFSLRDVNYIYDHGDEYALSEINLDINKGEFVAILGHNGSGKSTLAKLLNGLFIPTDGTVLVNNMDTYHPQGVPTLFLILKFPFQVEIFLKLLG